MSLHVRFYWLFFAEFAIKDNRICLLCYTGRIIIQYVHQYSLSVGLRV